MSVSTTPASSPGAAASSPPAGSDLLASLIRTWVPIAVGAALAWLAGSQHIVLGPHASATAGTVAAGALAAAWYALARAAERCAGTTPPARLTRAVGAWMLGGVRQPTYPNPDPTPAR